MSIQPKKKNVNKNKMERDHRNKIINNIDKLVQSTTYDDLMKECIDRKLLFDVMKREIEVSGSFCCCSYQNMIHHFSPFPEIQSK